MSIQLELTDQAPPAAEKPPEELTPQERFDRFIVTEQGKAIGNLFIRVAWGAYKRSLAGTGPKRLGSDVIRGRIRWHLAMRHRDGDPEGYKLNNNLTPYLARWAMDKEPRLKGFIPTKELGTAATRAAAEGAEEAARLLRRETL